MSKQIERAGGGEGDKLGTEKNRELIKTLDSRRCSGGGGGLGGKGEEKLPNINSDRV